MRYELLLQTGDAGVSFDPMAVESALAERSVGERRPDGTQLWRLKAGELEIRALVEGGVPRAIELRIPLLESPALVREAVIEGASLAAQAGLSLFDPQLGRSVSVNDEAAVAEQYLRTARYAGEMLGVSEALGASFSPAPEGLKPGTKVLLGLGALFALAWILLERVMLG